MKQRKGSGGYGTTQATILVLKAIQAYLLVFGKENVNEKATATLNMKEESVFAFTERQFQKSVFAPDMKNFATNGKNKLSLNFSDKGLPYTMRVWWDCLLPENDKNAPLHLSVKISEKTNLQKGKTCTMTAEMKNISGKDVPMSMMILGIPSGFSLFPNQLREMQTERIFDYYELKDNKLFIYFLETKKDAVVKLSFELKNEFSGKFVPPASCVYPYYNPDKRFWTNTGEAVINE